MPFEGHVADQQQGRAGMVVRTNRLNAEPGELIDGNGVQFDNVTLRKEAGSVLLDPVGIGVAPTFIGTYSVALTWAGQLAAYKGAQPPAAAPSFVKALGSSSPTSPTGPVSSNIIVIPAGGVAAGNLVILGIAQRSTGTSPNLVFQSFTVADSKGNVYTAAGPISPSAGIVRVVQYYAVITTPLVMGDTITVTYSSNSPACTAADEYTSIQAVPLDRMGNAAGVGTAKQVGPLGTLSAVPSLIIDADGAANKLSSATLAAPGWTARGTAENVGSLVQLRMFSRVDTTNPTIIGLFDFNPQFIRLGAGTVSVTKGSPVVTGVATSFLTADEANAGDFIRIGGETHRIILVSSDLSLTVSEPWFTTVAGSVYTLIRAQKLITATSDGAIYYDQNTGAADDIDFVLTKSGLVPSLIPGRFVLGGRENGPATARKLFWFSGRDPVQVINGVTLSTTNIALPPADWSGFNQPVNGVFSGASNRLVGFGNINDAHRLYFSSATNHEDFTTSPLTLEVYSGIGDRLYCGISFGGLLWLWKYPRGIFFVDDSDSSALVLRRKSEGLGCAPSPHAALAIDDDVLFVAANGAFHLLSAVDTMSGTRASDLSYRLGISKWLRDNVNLERLDQLVSLWYAHKKQAFFGVPSTGSDVCDLTLKFDFGGVDTGLPVRFSYTRRDTPGALALRRSAESALHDTVERNIEGEAGFVYLMDQEARNKAGAPYTGTFQTPHLDFSFAKPECRSKRKNWEHLEFVFEPVAAGSLVVQPFVDGQARGAPLTFNPTHRRDRKRIAVGPGHTLSIQGTESTLNGDFTIDDILVSYTISDEDQNVGPR